MKRFTTLILLILILKTTGFSQENLSKEECFKNKDFPRVYVPGFKDCLSAGHNHNISFRIKPDVLKNGFELKQTDSSFRIISFLLTFDSGDNLIEIKSDGNKILPQNDSIVSIAKITEATLITIDNIFVSKENIKRKLPSLIFYCIKD